MILRLENQKREIKRNNKSKRQGDYVMKKVFCVIMILLVFGMTNNVWSFDLSIDKLPKNYSGDDINQVINKMSKMGQKEEFETYDEWKQRISKYYVLNSNFVLKPKSITYDAEKEKFGISFNIDPLRNFTIVSEKEKYIGNFVGQNAFGAKWKCDRWLVNRILIINMNYNVEEVKYREIYVDKSKAKEEKGNISFLYITKNCTDIDTDKEVLNCRTDSTSEVSINRTFLKCEIIAVWIFNKKTGEIYYKSGDKNRPEEYYKNGKKVVEE